MIDEKREQLHRIPIRFIDGQDLSAQTKSDEMGIDLTFHDAETGSDEDTPSADEIGRASIYEDETEIARRIDRGQEEEGETERGEADERDTAGAPEIRDLPEHREDQDTNINRSSASEETEERATGAGDFAPEIEAAIQTHPAESGPMLAELIATRAELERVETELEKLKTERHDLREAVMRRQADFENYRKRVERERAETYHRTVGEIIGRLLPVMDNLQRALDVEASIEASESEEFRHFLHGVELINKQLYDVLESFGVESIATVGEPFDPHVHEAVAIEQTEAFEADIVIAELARGYRLGEKLLRPAMVKVATR